MKFKTVLKRWIDSGESVQNYHRKKGKKVRFNFLRREAKGWRQSWWEMNETKKKNGGIMKKRRRKIGHEG